jgi:hypothetical protein
MRIKLQIKIYLFKTIVAGCCILGSCAKDKVPILEIPEPTKWEKISGNYKVYDTNGVFLYEMSISHAHGNQNNTDSLIFENLDDKFTFTKWQSPWGSKPKYYIVIGDHDPIIDKNNDRWHLFQETDYNYNVLINDTIHLRFWKSNILYYIEDVTPYFEGFSEQIAVKQH